MLRLDADSVKDFANTLRVIHKSALPVVTRQTLNATAFDIKQKTMPAESDRFVHRNPTFFKANSTVKPAEGFEINTMESMVAFRPKPNDKSHSVEDLEEQETGGNINNRAFIATAKGRVGSSWNRNVKVKNRLGSIRNQIVDSRNATYRGRKPSGKQMYLLSALHAGVGGHVLNQDHSRVLLIKSITRRNGQTKVKQDIVYTVEGRRQAHVKATRFMKRAALKSMSVMELRFVTYARKKIASIK